MQLSVRTTAIVGGSSDFPLFPDKFDIDPKSGGLSKGQPPAHITEASPASAGTDGAQVVQGIP